MPRTYAPTPYDDHEFSQACGCWECNRHRDAIEERGDREFHEMRDEALPSEEKDG